jgi:YbbR domain-containing protein
VVADPPAVAVTLRGSHEALSAIKDEQLQPYVDLANVGPGQYTLQVHVDPRGAYVVIAIEPPAVSVRIR